MKKILASLSLVAAIGIAPIASTLFVGVSSGAVVTGCKGQSAKDVTKETLTWVEAECLMQHPDEEPAWLAQACAIDIALTPYIVRFLTNYRAHLAAARASGSAAVAASAPPAALPPASATCPPPPVPLGAPAMPPPAASSSAPLTGRAPKKAH